MALPSDPLERRSSELSKQYAKTAQRFETVQAETVLARRRFFENLTLLSSGAIVLSITFLGYLTSKPHSLVSLKFVLFSGWLGLLISIFSSLTQIWTNQSHVYFVWASEYHQRETDIHGLKIELLANHSVRIVGARDQFLSETEREQSARSLQAGKQSLVKETDRLKRLARRGLTLSKTAGRVALVFFFFGLLALIVFAVANSR